MNTKRYLVAGVISTMLSTAAGAFARDTWYVNSDPKLCCDLADPGCGETEAKPFCKIQDAITVSADADSIIVAPGTYTGEGNTQLTYGGKAITIQCDNAAAPCIINCEGLERAVYFDCGEDEDSVFQAFTVINGYAGGSYPEGGAIKCSNASWPKILNNTFHDNDAYQGGAIACLGSSSPTIQGNVFYNNYGNEGGAIYFGLSCDPIIEDNTFHDNHADKGGAIACTGSSAATIEDNVIYSNSAEHGGAIYCGAYSSAQIEGNAFSYRSDGNDAVHGGAIYCAEDSAPTIQENHIFFCTASQDGGGIFFGSNSDPAIAWNDISYCHARNGGGIYGEYADGHITDSTIGHNSTELHGGGLFLRQCSASVERCLISANEADGNGGGILLRKASYPEIRECTISDNWATGVSLEGGYGGGVYLTAGVDASVILCTISGNHAWYSGAGISSGYRLLNHANARIVNSVIVSNDVFGPWSPGDGYGGGGMYFIGLNDRQLELTNTLVTNNTAPHGGAIFVIGGVYLRIWNSTIADNLAGDTDGCKGGGIYQASDEDVTIENSILYGNDAHEGAQMWTTGQGDLSVHYSDVEGGWEGIANIDEDPLFVQDAYSLQENSPCIDIGNNDVVPADVYDVDGDSDTGEATPDLRLWPRLLTKWISYPHECEPVDMGGYEYGVPCETDEDCDEVYMATGVCLDEGVCEVCIERVYADVYPVPGGDGVAAGLDILCIWDAAHDVNWGCLDVLPSGYMVGDIYPCDVPDGAVEGFDILAVLDAANNNPWCVDPCECDTRGGGRGSGERGGDGIGEARWAFVTFLTTRAPVDRTKFRDLVMLVANWLADHMTCDQRAELAEELQDPSAKFASDYARRMVPSIVDVLVCE